MEVCEQNKAFVEKDKDLGFSHTKLILRDGDRYYYAIPGRRSSKVDLRELDLVPISTAHIWPLLFIHFTRAAEPLPQDCYVKRPSLMCYGDTEASTELSSLLLNEAEVDETLRASLYFNIGRY